MIDLICFQDFSFCFFTFRLSKRRGGVVAFLVVAGVGVQTRLRVRVVVKLRKQVRDLKFKIEGGG